MSHRPASTPVALLAALVATFAVQTGRASELISSNDAATWLQRMSNAARSIAFEGVFVVQHGASMQTMSIVNRPAGTTKDSRLAALDGNEREIRCSESGSVSRVTEGGRIKLEKRLNNRYFPDLLPPNAAALANWYDVRLGKRTRVAGLECQQVEMAPKDAYRWGYVLCAEKVSGLPLKAVMVNESGKPLMQYAFAEIHIGAPAGDEQREESKAQQSAWAMPPMSVDMRPIGLDLVNVRNLPPGFSRITAVKRKLPHKSAEVEHWVFSDGLTHISLFLEPATHPVESIRGQSKQGMINMAKRQVGTLQATILGDAPWPAIEAIATGLEARPEAAEK